MSKTFNKKTVAAGATAVVVVVSTGIVAYQFSSSTISTEDLIARWLESATSWSRDKPDAAAGGAIASVVRDSLKKSAPAAQVTSAAVSADCDQESRLMPGTALVGDRLAIRFFEREAIDPATLAAGTSPMYFERLDLSGTYEVDARGEVSLPLMGRVKAEGRSTACLEAAVAVRQAKTFSAPASVSVAFASRAPVLVTGAVRAEGAYNYTPGMTLRHVLALAGELSPQNVPAADIPLLARKAELDALKAGTHLEMLALASARAGSATIAMTLVERVNFIAAVGTERLEIESANLRARVEAYNREQKELAKHIEHGRARIELLSEEKSKLERHVKDKLARLKELRDLTARGIAPLSRLNADESLLTALEGAMFNIKVELLQAESKLEADVRALDAIANENERTISAELRDRAKESDSIEAQLASIEIQLGAQPHRTVAASSGSAPLYTIVRTTTQGTARSESDLDSPVLPGDLVEVETSTEAERVTSLR